MASFFYGIPYPSPASLKWSCLENAPARAPFNCWSTPSLTACIFAQVSSNNEKIPGGLLPSIRSQTVKLLKYSISFHFMPSSTYSSYTMKCMRCQFLFHS